MREIKGKIMQMDIFSKRLSSMAPRSAAVTVGSTLSSNGYRTFPQQSLTPFLLRAKWNSPFHTPLGEIQHLTISGPKAFSIFRLSKMKPNYSLFCLRNLKKTPYAGELKINQIFPTEVWNLNTINIDIIQRADFPLGTSVNEPQFLATLLLPH